MKCPNHNLEMVWREGGVSKKTGKPYAGFFSCPGREADGGFCKYKPPKPQNNLQQFDQDLDKSASQYDQTKREAIITRTAIAKSLIESGKSFSLETVTEAQRWIDWIEGKGMHKPMAMGNQPVETEEVTIDQIPF